MITLADLQGVWRLDREIEDLRGQVTGRLEGLCRFVPDAGGLRQEEAGLLRMGDAPPMQAQRVYLWRQAGVRLSVLFEDGRPFHGLAPGRLTDRHWCAPDSYEVSYAFDAWPVWTQRWRVSGPRKDALITSRFQPAG